MEGSTKTDLRVVKTKKAIRQAFAELMNQKPLEAITVSDVAAKAMINRKTFYAHYRGVHEIIAEIEDEITTAIEQLFVKKKVEEMLNTPYDLFHDVLAIINSDMDVYGRLLTLQGRSALVPKIIGTLRIRICEAVESEVPVDRQTLDMAVYFMLSGLLAVFTEWYNSGRRQNIEELSRKMSVLCLEGFHGMMQRPAV